MLPPMPILTPGFPTRYGRGGVTGEAAGVAAEVAGSAGAGWHPTGTPGGRTTM